MTDAEQFEAFLANPVVEAFVQKNIEYYRANWRKMFAKKQSISLMIRTRSWNWAAFLLGPMWMLYRKMYVYASAWIGVMLVLTIAETVSGHEIFSSSAGIGSAAVFGMHANGWYFRHIYDKFQKAAAAGASIDARAAGTSWVSAIVGTAVIAVLFGIASSDFLNGFAQGFKSSFDAAVQGDDDVSTPGPQRTVTSEGQPANVPEQVAVAPPPPNRVAGFSGKFPTQLLEASQLHDQAMAVLGDRYKAFADGFDESRPVDVVQDCFVVGQGCAKSLCQIYESFFVYNVDTGELFAATTAKGSLEVLSGQNMNVPDQVTNRYKQWTKRF